MTNHASQQPRKEQESYQPLWDDSLPVPSYMNISLGNSEAPSEASPQQVSEDIASPAAKSALEWEPEVYSHKVCKKYSEAREQRWNAEEAPAFWYYPVYIG